MVVTVAKEHSELRQRGNGARDGRGDRHDQGVTIFDMSEFMGHHSRSLFRREQLEQSGCRRDGGVLWVTPGRECVWLGLSMR